MVGWATGIAWGQPCSPCCVMLLDLLVVLQWPRMCLCYCLDEALALELIEMWEMVHPNHIVVDGSWGKYIVGCCDVWP